MHLPSYLNFKVEAILTVSFASGVAIETILFKSALYTYVEYLGSPT